MLTPAQLFRLLNEMVFVLLGALLALVAMSGRSALPHRLAAWIALGVFLIYWGIRAWARPDRSVPLWQSRVRGGSLVLVGALLLGMVWLPLAYAAPLLGAAGGVLVLRGLASAVLFARIL